MKWSEAKGPPPPLLDNRGCRRWRGRAHFARRIRGCARSYKYCTFRQGSCGFSCVLLAFLFHSPETSRPQNNLTVTMDKAIDERFERLETALAKLINSISAYNPAPALATDLVAADVELSEGLEQCMHTLLLMLGTH
jgi:hypothetical protein